MDQLLDIETLKKLTPEQQNQVIAGVKQQAAIVNAQNLITDLSEKCTSKCITAPGASLSGSYKTSLEPVQLFPDQDSNQLFHDSFVFPHQILFFWSCKF
uniref:Tim10-like domain-containing protein n=1 Tax=Panagrolaimus sp. JU765 TaxID=591449 RepID=A0AC34QFK4_9BILA